MIPISCKLNERGVIGHLLRCNLERKFEQDKEKTPYNLGFNWPCLGENIPFFSGVSCWSKHWVGGKKLVEIIDSRWHFQLAAALTFSSWEKNIPKLDFHFHLTSSVNESPNVVPTCPVLMVGSVIESESGLLLDTICWSQEVVEEFSRKISLFQNHYHRLSPPVIQALYHKVGQIHSSWSKITGHGDW